MSDRKSGCLICGKPLQYYETEREMTCVRCGKAFRSNVSCEESHYICDVCHAERGAEIILEYFQTSSGKDPIKMVQEMMEHPFIHMHGNEHHIMVGAALIAAYHNAGGKIDRRTALQEMKVRGSKYPGGSCGFWGCCGAAVSTGMFLSIVTGATPLSGKSWGLANRMTAQALEQIGKVGGPRCCKRNSFLAIQAAAEFVEKNLGVHMEMPKRIQCCFSSENRQCLKKGCPYYIDSDRPLVPCMQPKQK